MLMTYSTVCCVAQSYWFYLKKINRSLLVGLRQILAAGGSFAGLLAAAALHFWHDDDEGPCAIRFHVAFGVILPPLSPCSCQLLLRRRAIYPALQGVKYFANAVECTWNKGRDTAPTWPPVCFHVTRQKLNCTWHRWWDGKDLGGARQDAICRQQRAPASLCNCNRWTKCPNILIGLLQIARDL